jgi:predicted outer membrane repeat protein
VTATLSGLVIDGFHTTSPSGGIFNIRGGKVTITDSVISNNSASTADSQVTYGGGIYNTGTLVVSGSTFTGNSAKIGGAIYNTGTLSVTNSTFAFNTATTEGGAIANAQSGKFSFGFTTISQNTAPIGGGIQNINGTASLLNVIVANNTSSNGPDIKGNVTATNSLIGNATGSNVTGSSNSLNVNALLGSLDYYGGKTQLFPLLPGSPAIDSGRGTDAMDQRGVTVVGKADMGSFQSRGFTITNNGGGNQTAMIGNAFATNLTLSIASAYAEPVNGGLITFTLPTSVNAPSSVLTGSTLINGGNVSVQASANAYYGTVAKQNYNIIGSASGASVSATYQMLNVGTPATITAVSGNNQSGDLNSNFTTPLAVNVKDSVGNNIPGISVRFSPTATSYGANGTLNGLSNVTTTTDSNGNTGNITYKSNGVGGLVAVQANATVSAVPGVRLAATAISSLYEGAVGINVQNGNRGRSFVNSVSGIFGNSTLASSLAATRVKIQYLGYTGTDSPANVTLANGTASSSSINWNYGTKGITGNPDSQNGDGVYQLAVDYNLDGIYETSVKFHRLFGDVNGDGTVDNTDVNAIKAIAVFGKYNVLTGEDTNGSGRVFTEDVTNATKQRGRKVTFKKY